MKFEIDYDSAGKPDYVRTDDGFTMTGQPFDEEQHGWMLDQLDPHDFPAIQIGRQMAALVAEVNALRRELWHERKINKIVMGGL